MVTVPSWSHSLATTASRIPGHVPFAADTGEEGFGGLVRRVLRDELAAAGALEHRAAEGGGAATGPLDRSAERVDRREPCLNRRHGASPLPPAARRGDPVFTGYAPTDLYKTASAPPDALARWPSSRDRTKSRVSGSSK